MTAIETASPEQLNLAKQKMEANHVAYSAAFHRREDAEKDLTVCAARRAALILELKKTARSVGTEINTAIQNAIDNPASADSSKVTTLQAKARLLKRSLQKYSAWEYAECERMVLTAKVEELVCQKRFEESRLFHQEQAVLATLSTAMGVTGDLEVNSLGSITGAMEKLVHEIGERLLNAREELREHDRVTREAQETFQKENSTWLN